MIIFGGSYDLVSPTKSNHRGIGEWKNNVTILCLGPEIGVAVNGEEITKMNCDDFPKPGLHPTAVNTSFIRPSKKCRARGISVPFQDHGHPVWYKNVKLLGFRANNHPAIPNCPPCEEIIDGRHDASRIRRTITRFAVDFHLARNGVCADAFADEVKPTTTRWLADVNQLGQDLKAEKLPQVEWQKKIEELFARVDLPDLLRLIDFERLTANVKYVERGAEAALRFRRGRGGAQEACLWQADLRRCKRIAPWYRTAIATWRRRS